MNFITRQDHQQEITLHYEIIGKGEPIVFHHGNGNCIKDWHTLGYVDELAKDFQLILIDSRGYGKSSKPHDPAAYSLVSRAADTIAVLDAVGIHRAHCFGASIGAAICFILAKHYPERFKSYIFATPYFTKFDDTIKAALRNGSAAFLAKLEELVGSRLDSESDNQSIRQTLLANDSQALIAANSSEWFNYLEYIKYLYSPSLIYVGDQEPSVNEMKFLAEKLLNNELVILPNMNHVQAYWDGKLVAPVIRDFVNRVK